MPQAFPFVISGVAQLNGVPQSGINISIKNNTKNQTGVWATDSAGEYAASLSDPVQFSSGYDVGDSITVSSSFCSNTLTVPSGAGSTVGGATVNLIGLSFAASVSALASAAKACTFSVAETASVSATESAAKPCVFNIAKFSSVSASESAVKACTFNIAQLASVLAQGILAKTSIFNISKSAPISASETTSLKMTFTILKSAPANASSAAKEALIFNVVKNAIVDAFETLQINTGQIYSLDFGAAIKASATEQIRQTLSISESAVIVSASLPSVKTIFNISEDAQVLAEVTVWAGTPKVTKLFLVIGNIVIDLKTGHVDLGI